MGSRSPLVSASDSPGCKPTVLTVMFLLRSSQFSPDKESLQDRGGQNIDRSKQHPEEVEEDEDTLEALDHLGQGLLSLLASLQPGVDLVVSGEELSDGEEEGEAGGDRHTVQVGGELGDQEAGDTQEVEENPAKHEDKLERKNISGFSRFLSSPAIYRER